MNRSLRHSARTQSLRLMAWFAWLIMAMAPAHGTPAGMVGDGHPASMISSMTQAPAHVSRGMSGMADDCCAGQLHHGEGLAGNCHCPAACAATLPLTGMQELGPIPPVIFQVPPHGPDASGVVHAPPLRPPMSRTARSS
ncbi:hypothetical protein ACFPPA_11570 [Rhodanobacter ginsengisoli]|uniref:CopL family metal-binding regulatory protein n=1 Tax=Rhodanobacter ginsengisoli TaxID=418646 RepID=A0ABW0QN17_9GAMM